MSDPAARSANAGHSPKAVIENWFDVVWTKGDRSAIRRLFVGTAGGIDPAEEAPATVEVYEAHWDAYHAALDNIHARMVECIEQGNRGSGIFELTAIHKASGRPIKMVGMGYFSIDDEGRIVDAINVLDLLGLAQQLGQAPPDAASRILAGEPLA